LAQVGLLVVLDRTLFLARLHPPGVVLVRLLSINPQAVLRVVMVALAAAATYGKAAQAPAALAAAATRLLHHPRRVQMAVLVALIKARTAT
jgi:hypothetical protein